MTTIFIKELRRRTGHWLRRVNEEREVIVTERGRPSLRIEAHHAVMELPAPIPAV